MTEYIRILFQNREPLKIADDSSSQSGQVNALAYVPGASIRGVVIGEWSRNGEFESYKRMILSDQVAFLNAYLTDGKQEMIPSFHGFYEDKSDSGSQAKNIENMLINGKITPGNKRAGLGRYCYAENSCIFYTGVEMGSDMKINKGYGKEKKNVFRNQYIVPGYRFVSYIAIHDSEIFSQKLFETLDRIKKENRLVIGGNRSYGYGKCQILSVERTDRLPYARMAVKKDVNDQVYMVLLSNMAMVNELGENVGIDRDILADKLNLSSLQIQFCSASTVDVRGYNRTWQAMTPSLKMYDAGSVFKLIFPGESVSLDTMRSVMNEGIGVRTNEGYGRVLFLDDYESLKKKKNIEVSPDIKENTRTSLDESEKNTLMIAAKGYYLNLVNRAINTYIADSRNSIGRFGLKGTQLGTIESILLSDLYKGENGFVRLLKYFKTAKEKDAASRKQKTVQKREKIAAYVEDNIIQMELPQLLGTPEYVMGMRYDEVLTPGEIVRIKQDLVIQQIRFLNRGGRNDG